MLRSAVSEPASYLAVLARRTPFLAAAWFVGRIFFVATTLAYLTYSLFDWFDRKEASPPRKRAISAWLKGQPYRQLDLKSAVIGAFDRLYGFPLMSITGFFRASRVPLIIYVGFQCVHLLTSEEIRNLFANQAARQSIDNPIASAPGRREPFSLSVLAPKTNPPAQSEESRCPGTGDRSMPPE